MTALSTEEQNAGERSREELETELSHWRKEYLAASLGEQTALAELSALRGEVGKLAAKAFHDGFLQAIHRTAWEEMYDWLALTEIDYARSLLSTLEGNDSIVSRASLPAHVSEEETATEALRSTGKEG